MATPRRLDILIVDNNCTVRASIKAVLSSRFPGIYIEEAETGEEALQKLELFAPDIIFMDIQLPGKSGLELAKTILNSHNLIVIILSSYDIPEYRDAAFKCGAHYFLSKSNSTYEELVALVEAIHSQKGLP